MVEKLTTGEVRPFCEPGVSEGFRVEPDWFIRFRWYRLPHPTRGWRLAFTCPWCSSDCRVLRRLPGKGWRCHRCEAETIETLERKRKRRNRLLYRRRLAARREREAAQA